MYVRKLVEKGDKVNVFPNSGRIVPEENINFIREVFHDDYRIVYSIMDNFISNLTVHYGAKQLKVL